MARSLGPWKRFRFRLEVVALRIVIAIVSRLPRPILLRVARTFGSIAYHVDKRGRGIALENLRLAFPDKGTSEITEIAKASYRHQALSTLDLIWAARNLTAERATKLVRYTFEDCGDFDQIGEEAAIWVTPHYGSFEWLSTEWSLTHEKKPMIVAQDFRNPGLTPIFRDLRAFSGNTIISSERAMVRLLKHVKRGGQTAFLTDLRTKPNKASTIIECFGFKTSVTLLHAFLAIQTGAPVIPVICLPQTDGTYRFHFYPRIHASKQDHPQDLAQRCWDVFEKQICEDPAPWLWMYKHWRYLPKDSERPYPAYASESKAFNEAEERLAAEQA